MGAGLQLVEGSGAAVLPAALKPPPVSLEPMAPRELLALVRAGENESDTCERVLAQVARVEGALDLAIGEGLLELGQGNRLIALGSSSLRDYAREVLDLGERTAQALVQLARELRTRPLLHAAVLAGEVRIRHAQTVLPVAVGEAEARWVERAREETVRELEIAVRKERAGGEPEDLWTRMRVGLSPEDRTTVDEALQVAGRLLPGSSRAERLEVMAQEYLGEHALEAGDDGGGPVGGAFRAEIRKVLRAQLEERFERESGEWAYLRPPVDVPVPEANFDEFSTEQEIHAHLRELAARRAAWDGILGYCAHVVVRSRLWKTAGFANFSQYCTERLGLAARTVEQRAALERRIWEVSALRAARDAGLSYEKLRLLARLPDGEIEEWVARARELTRVELATALDDREETQMRAARLLGARVPERVALLLQAAFRAAREVEGRLIGDGACLVRVARHFLETWRAHVKKARTRSQKVRERDLGRCQVPGCSRRACHAHHIVPRSRGGSDEPWNLVALCALHHLIGIHAGYIRVRGHAPDGLVWEMGPPHALVDLRWFCLTGGDLRAAAVIAARAA
jgi:hypothetical protein